MLDRKVDTDFSSELSSKNPDDSSMEVTRRVVTWDRGSVVDMKLSMSAGRFCSLVISSDMVFSLVEVKPSWLVLLFHMSVGRHNFPVRSSNLEQGSLVLGDMLGWKVDTETAFPLLYPEFSNKYKADLSM